MRHARQNQAGVTLVVSLIFLAIFMVVAVAMVNSGLINVKVAANQQHTVEARDAAQQAVEQIISQDFTITPAASSVQVDVTGDGKADYTAQVDVPTCVASKPVAKVIDPDKHPEDADCSLGSGTANGNLVLSASGAAAVSSLCNDTQWDVTANVNDANATATAVTVHQGIAVRTLYGSTCP